MERKPLTDAQKSAIINGSNKIVVVNIVNDTHAKFVLCRNTTKMTSGRWVVSPPTDLEPLATVQFYSDAAGPLFFKTNSGVISYSYTTSTIRESKKETSNDINMYSFYFLTFLKVFMLSGPLAIRVLK